MELILASASRRRSELMKNCGWDFTVIPSRADEDVTAGSPKELVEKLALTKAEAVFWQLEKERRMNAAVIGADTVVVLDGEVIGKPASGEEARRMLRAESGRVNTVYTGVAVLSMNGDEVVRSVVSDSAEVLFSELTDDEIAAYVATGDPMDKAGAYGIQGPFSAHIEGVRGSYFTVVGLPVHLLYRELKKLGILPHPGV